MWICSSRPRQHTWADRSQNVRRNSQPVGSVHGGSFESSASLTLRSRWARTGSPCGPRTWWAASRTRRISAPPSSPQKRSVKAIGIDAEVAASVTEKLWPRLFLGPEIEWLHSLTMTQRLSAAALLFSAKEAFYKCQYPLVRQSLGFHDVLVCLPHWVAGASDGTFLIEPQRKIELLEHTSSPMRGRYLFLGSIVATGIAIMEQASL